MKLLIAMLATAALGLGGYHATTTSDTLPVAPAPEECKVKVIECTPEKCVIACQSPDGKVCVMEIACEEGKCAVKSCQGTPCDPGACK